MISTLFQQSAIEPNSQTFSLSAWGESLDVSEFRGEDGRVSLTWFTVAINNKSYVFNAKPLAPEGFKWSLDSSKGAEQALDLAQRYFSTISDFKKWVTSNYFSI